MRNATDITVILDRSGSMESIRTDTIGGFNAFVDEQKGSPGDCVLSLIQFDSQNAQEVVFDAETIADVPPLTPETFRPRASTPLYDALGQAIVRTGERFAAMLEEQRPEKVLFIVITDGLENASTEYAREKVLAMIGTQEKDYGWTFVYLGANQDALKVGQSIGVHQDAAMSYTAAGPQVRAAYAGLSRNVIGARAASGPRAAGASMAWKPEQRQSSVRPPGPGKTSGKR